MSFDPDVALRLGAGVGCFLLLAAIEVAAPWRAGRLAKGRRWARNLALAAVDALVARLLLPGGVVGVAWLAAERGWGLFAALAAPPLVAGAVSFLALDLVVYLQHRLFHAVPALWRFHRVHHADGEVDVSTGNRFHPVEIALSLALQSATAMALGAPPGAVLLFQIVLNASSLFTHANFALPAAVERPLRWLLVTPTLHRIHHSAAPGEADHNFGFDLVAWDRLFGTLRAAPEAGEARLELGLRDQTRGDAETFAWLLASPFARGGSAPPPAGSNPAGQGGPAAGIDSGVDSRV